MSPLRLNGSTSGNVSLDAPAVAGNNTLTLPTGNGSAGQFLQTNGSGALGWSDILANRNRIINGGMDIWQRGTTQTTTGYGSVDRWNMTAAGTCTFSQEASVIPSGAQYALKWTTGASSSYGQVRQYIEQLNVIPLRGQTVTASVYVRSGGTFTGNYLFEIAYNTSSDASGAGWSIISTTTSGTINSSSYTQIKTTFTVPSNAVGLVFGLVPDTVQSSGAIVYQSLAQLEPGSVATPFERSLYSESLARCQRYYQVFGDLNLTISGRSTNAATTVMPIVFRTTMRAAPTVAGTLTVGSGLSFSSTIDTMRVIGTADGNGTFVVSNSTASAEL
jgi:hypothetical protein